MGEAYATRSNAQGGINLVKLGDGQWDSNPEAIHLSSKISHSILSALFEGFRLSAAPLDGTRNPTTTVVLGTKLETM